MSLSDDLVQKEVNCGPPRRNVLGVAGSPRKGGNSDILLAEILSGVEAGNVDSRSIQLREFQYQGCIGCERCRKDKSCTGLKDGMSLIYPYVLEARGLVLVSPTHNYNITSWMKAFIDRLYCFYSFDENRPRGWSSRLADQNRKAVLAAVCEQENIADMGFTLEAMRFPLQALGYEIVGELPVFAVFDRAGVRENVEVMTAAGKLGTDLAKAISIPFPV